jgi:hypothetical protein
MCKCTNSLNLRNCIHIFVRRHGLYLDDYGGVVVCLIKIMAEVIQIERIDRERTAETSFPRWWELRLLISY